MTRGPISKITGSIWGYCRSSAGMVIRCRWRAALTVAPDAGGATRQWGGPFHPVKRTALIGAKLTPIVETDKPPGTPDEDTGRPKYHDPDIEQALRRLRQAPDQCCRRGSGGAPGGRHG